MEEQNKQRESDKILPISSHIIGNAGSDDLTSTEQVIAGYRHQVKIRSNISENAIHELGAKRLGTVHHEDKYFIPRDQSFNNAHKLIRIRKEADKEILFIYEGAVADRGIRNKLTNSEVIQRQQVMNIKKSCRKIVNIDKTRTIFLLGSIVLNVDVVLNLGTFVELVAIGPEHSARIDSIINKLRLEAQEPIRLSYFELALMNQKRWQRILSTIHDQFGRFSFGISSAVLTTLGMVVGLNAATSSRVAVIAGIVAVAVADSLSDSMGIYTSQRVESGTTSTCALMAAVNTFLGKFIFTLSFILPFVFLSFSYAIYTSIAWGAVLLGLVSIQIAFVQEERVAWTILKNEIVAASIIVISFLAGKCVAMLS